MSVWTKSQVQFDWTMRFVHLMINLFGLLMLSLLVTFGSVAFSSCSVVAVLVGFATMV